MTFTIKANMNAHKQIMKQSPNEIVPPIESTRSNSFLGQHWQKLVAVGLWAVIIGAYTWYARANNLTPVGSIQALVNLMQNSFYGPLIFFVLYALRPLIFFSAAILTIAGGFLFGPVLGVIYTILGANTSAMLAFVIGRYLGDGLINVNASEGIVQRYAHRMQENSFETVLIMRFIFLPYDLVNYLGGLLRLDWKAFLLATAVGSIPGTISFSLIGASLESFSFENGLPKLDFGTLVAGGVLFIVSLAISRYFKSREQRTNSDTNSNSA